MNSSFRVGIDLGGTSVRGVVLDDGDAEIVRVRMPTRRGREGVVASVLAVVERLGTVLPPAGIRSVGIGVPGVVDPASGQVRHAVNLGLDGASLPLAEAVTDALGVAVRVDHDVTLAALGAARLLGIEGDLALLSLGTGIAAGLLLGGRAHRGARGGAGEIGHVPLVADGPRCPCGQRGCLEMYASGTALAAAWREAGGASVTHPAVAVLAAAEAGDAAAQRVLDTFVDAVAAGVRLLVLTVDVETVVLGGGVAALGEPLLTRVRASLARQAEGSGFLAELDLPGRTRLMPDSWRAAAVGAALVGGAARDDRSEPS